MKKILSCNYCAHVFLSIFSHGCKKEGESSSMKALSMEVSLSLFGLNRSSWIDSSGGSQCSNLSCRAKIHFDRLT